MGCQAVGHVMGHVDQWPAFTAFWPKLGVVLSCERDNMALHMSFILIKNMCL